MMKHRESPIEISKDEFKEIGYQLIGSISDFIDTIREKSVTPAETSEQLRKILGHSSLPENGTSASELLMNTSDLLLSIPC